MFSLVDLVVKVGIQDGDVSAVVEEKGYLERGCSEKLYKLPRPLLDTPLTTVNRLNLNMLTENIN